MAGLPEAPSEALDILQIHMLGANGIGTQRRSVLCLRHDMRLPNTAASTRRGRPLLAHLGGFAKAWLYAGITSNVR